MAITRTQTQVTWSSASTKSVTSATEVTSDVFTIDDTCVALVIQCHADNASSPSATDTAVFKIQWSTGDVAADTGDDYDTSEHAQYLMTLNTYASSTPGEDPARRTVILEPVASKFKIAVTCANAASHNITVAVRVDEIRAA